MPFRALFGYHLLENKVLLELFILMTLLPFLPGLWFCFQRALCTFLLLSLV